MTCPICDKDTAQGSKRCADIDLAKWLSGSYAIPSENPDELDELMDELERAKDPETPPRLS